MSLLEIRLFGEPSFTFDGAPWRFAPPPRALPLLVYLALRPGTPVLRTRLAALLWPDDTDETARANLRRHLHQLQRALPPLEDAWIRVQGATVCWNASAPARVDAVDFERLAREEVSYAAAVDLYRGDLAESLYDEWIIAERERLRALQLDLLHGLGIRARGARDFASAISHAERMLALDEWREDALRLNMIARYETGDRTAALAAYDRFAGKLREHLRVEPMPETQRLRERIAENAALELASAPEAAAVPYARAHRTPMIGRIKEADRLRAEWTRAARGHGTIVFVAGEAGIGKSRLASDLAVHAEAEGARVLWGTTADPESAPYQAFVEAIRSGLGYFSNVKSSDAWLSALSKIVPEIRTVYPHLQLLGDLDAVAERKRLLDALAQAAGKLSQVRPLLLVLEDLHWASDGALLALDVLARRIARQPVLVVVTYRNDDSEATQRLRSLRRELQRQRYAHQIALSRLTAAETEELVARAALDSSISGAGAFVYRLSEGNPLFAALLLREIHDLGRLPEEVKAYRTLGSAVAARIARLEPQSAAIVQAASVLGRSFSVDVLAQIGGWDERAVLDAMEELLDRSIVAEEAGFQFEYAFTHAVVQNAAYASMADDVRVHRHRRAARIIERQQSDEPRLLRSVAAHWDAAGDPSRARSAYQRAAEAALAVYARDHAVHCAHRAYELSVHDDERYAALRIAAQAQAQYGDVGSWRADIERLEEVAGRLGENERFTALELRERLQWQTGDRGAQRQTIFAMLGLAQSCERPDWRLTAHYALGNLLTDEGNLVDAEEPLQHALEIAAQLGNARLSLQVRQRLIQLWVRLNDLDRARKALDVQRAQVTSSGSDADRLQLVRAEGGFGVLAEDAELTRATGDEMLAIARRLGDLEAEGKALHLLAISAHLRFDIESAIRYYEAGLDVFARLVQMQAMAVGYVNYGGLMADCGHLDEAVRLIKHAITIAKGAGAQIALANAYLILVYAAIDGERFAEALPLAQQAYELAAGTGERKLMGGTLVYLGRVKFALGDREGGLADIRAGVAMREETMAIRQILDDRCSLLEALVACGKSTEARTEAAKLSASYAESGDHARAVSRMCLTIGKAHEAFGEPEEAQRWFGLGRERLEGRLRQFTRDQDARAYSSLPFNRELLARFGSAPEMQTTARSS